MTGTATAARASFRPAVLLISAALLLLFAPTGGADPFAQPTAAPAAAPLATFDAAWQAIRETYVDERSEEDWRLLHDEFRRRAAAAPDDAALRPVLRDLLEALGRSHFELVPGPVHERINPERSAGEDGDVGVEVAIVEGEVVVSGVDPDSAAFEAGLRPGWVVEGLDGFDPREVGFTPGTPASPAQAFRVWAVATALLRGSVGSTLRLAVRDGADRQTSLSIVRRRQAGEPVKFGHLPTFFARVDEKRLAAPGGRHVAYIHFNVWMTPIAEALERAVAGVGTADGIILDLRRNPGGVLTMLMGVSGYFLTSPISLGTIRMRDSELKLMANPRFVGGDGAPARPFEGKLAVLVDASSYSASEIFAGGMQAVGRARVFGSPSPGGALPAMLRRLPNGDLLEYAIGDFVTARGERIEGRGVTPDEIVPLTRSALLAGADPTVDAAVAWIVRDGAGRP
jgi:carboxyl-terminal processing protease